MKKYLLTIPLLLVTSVALAGWKSKSASVEETPMNDVTTHDEDRSAFIDLTTMVAAGDLEGAQSQVIEAATERSGFYTKLFREILPHSGGEFRDQRRSKTNHRDFSGGTFV